MPSLNPALLVGGVIAAFVGVFSIFLTTLTVEPTASMELIPHTEIATQGEKFTIHIVVEASEPVNVFAGELLFDNSILRVDSIDYNTSVADLWAERPWFSNGEGTMNFVGGTTQKGGFLGRGDLITITFETLRTGQGNISITDPRILRHDGKGTDTELKETLDTTILIEGPVSDNNLVTQQPAGNVYTVTPEKVSTDLNGDGKQTIADVSIFMLNITGNDSRFDFNLDGKVNTKDLAILLSL